MEPSFRSTLEQLKRLETFSPFARLFYELVAQRLWADRPTDPSLVEGFAVLVARELRFHRRLASLEAGSDPSPGDLVSLADKRRVSLQDIIDLLEAATPHGDHQEATRRLMLAECRHHLARFDRAVADLEAALSLGAEEPIVHFALGYNRYILAGEAFTVQDGEGAIVVLDQARHRDAMLDAVAAFENALTGGAGDGHVYHWIAVCLRQAGFPEAAADALERASDAEEAAGPRDDADDDYLLEQLPELPPISPEEIRRVGELLKRSYSVSDLLGSDERQ